MKRIAGILAAVLVAAIALFALFVVLLPRETLKTQIGRQIAGWTGRDVSLAGEPQINIFPRLSVTLNDVTVGGPPGMADAEIISMDRLTGRIRLAPLLIGRVEIDSFSLVRPRVQIVRDEEGRRNWAFDAGAAALQLAFAGDVPLGVFNVEGGTILYEDRKTGEAERFDSVNIRVEWTSVRTPLAIEGSTIWRGEQVSFSGGAKAPFAFLSGAQTPVEARIESAPVSMIFNGTADDYPRPHLSGALKLSSASLRRFANWLGSPVGPGSTLGQASLFGTAEFGDGVLSVADAQLTVDGNSASGAVKVTAGKSPDITGTLAFESLDLTPYFAGLSTAISTTSDWRKVQLPTGWFGDMSADVRLSAGSVKLGSLALGSTAASALLRDGQLEIGVARADLGGGSLTGDLAIVAGNAPRVEAQIRATNVDLASTGPALGLPSDVAGSGSLVVDVATSGDDLGQLLDGLNGTGRLDIRQGAVPLFGIAEVAANAGLSTGTGSMDNLTPLKVEAASVGLSFSGGVAVLERATLATSSYTAEAQGWIGLADGTLGLNGTIKAPGATADSEKAVPFTIEGTLAAPDARPLALEN